MAKSTHILFIGNSFTNRNDLPGMLSRLAGSHDPRKVVETDRIIANGMALRAHWNRGLAREAIQRRPWNYVVLQEQSTLPLKNRAKMHESITLFVDEIRNTGAKPVLYMTWARANAHDRQDVLADAYLSVGRSLKVLVAPVGLAWQSALKRNPKFVLHDKDGSHPNALGTYLAACVFYATLFKASPAGLPLDSDLSKQYQADDIRALQDIAWRTAKKFAASDAKI